MADETPVPPEPIPASDHGEYARLLRRVELFTGLDRVTLAKLAAHLQPQSFQPGAVIVRQGDIGDAFYLVARGSVGVYAVDNAGGEERLLKLLHVGEPFGEMALLNDIPRTATVKAESACEVLRL